MRGERGCLPDRCRAPQNERTPLHWAARSGRAVAGQLLAAKADVEAKDDVVRGGG